MWLFAEMCAALLGGVATWSFLEYTIHNWWGHKPKGRNQFSKLHLTHHADANFFAPTWEKVKMALIVSGVAAPPAILLMGPWLGLAYVTGLMGFYTTYEVLHRRIHTHGPRGWYGRMVRRHHLLHHFTRPHHNHGVTSPIWDVVFRTYTRPDVVKVPRRQAMVWLCDESGEVKPEHTAHYELVGRPRRRRGDSPATA